jgi:hypothetical protein
MKSYFDYFRKNNELNSNPNSNYNLSDEDKQKLELLEDELIELYEQIDIKYIYNCLHTINKEFNENSNLKEILDFLYIESNFILQNKDNLEISLNKIKENTYVLELISKFKLLEDIKEKETFIKSLDKKPF